MTHITVFMRGMVAGKTNIVAICSQSIAVCIQQDVDCGAGEDVMGKRSGLLQE